MTSMPHWGRSIWAERRSSAKWKSTSTAASAGSSTPTATRSSCGNHLHGEKVEGEAASIREGRAPADDGARLGMRARPARALRLHVLARAHTPCGTLAHRAYRRDL